MKILLIAFSCNPNKGSESFCGWSWAKTLAKNNEVCVITRSENQSDIDQYLNENKWLYKNLNLIYHDIPQALNFYYETRKLYLLYYIIWLKTVAPVIKKIDCQEHFDIVHQVTLGDFRHVANLSSVEGKKVFGPVGGAQITPPVFKPYINTKRRMLNEKLREIANRFTLFDSSYKKRLNICDLVLVANYETEQTLRKVMEHPERCVLMSENGIHKENQREYISRKKEGDDEINIIWSGRMIYRKGLEFLLDVLCKVNTKRKYSVTLVGTGPEVENLKRKSEQMGLSQVCFMGKVSYQQMDEIYRKSDIFVFPSLRETTGTVLLEAMERGLPVVTFDQNGAKVVLDKTCAELIPVTSDLEEIKTKFASSLQMLIDDDVLRMKMSENSYYHAYACCTWEDKIKRYFALLEEN